MFDDFDPRDRGEDIRDIEMPWIELGRGPGSDREEDDHRDRADDIRDRDRDVRERDHGPRDVFLHGLELLRGPERELEELSKGRSTLRLRAIGHGPHWASNGRFLPCCREQLRKMNLHMHDLRRDAGSRLLERGADLHTVQLFLDHANISTSSRYLKPSKLALHTTIQRIDAQRRESGEAAKWERDLVELRKNCRRGHKKGHTLIELLVSVRSEKTATPPRVNRSGA